MKTKKVQPSQSEIIATAQKGITKALEGLEGGRNPHVVGVREQLKELQAVLLIKIASRQEAIIKRDAARAAV
jgi:hypothetical protein